MSVLEPYLFFDGTCRDAMHFYERTLGGKIEMMMTHGEAPDAAQSPPGSAERILHARLAIQGRALMASDDMVGHPYGGMKGFSLSLTYRTVAEAHPVFDALAAGGQIRMPMQKTFWAEGFGMLVDRFGTPWMISVPAADA
jgi:PhnB protein